MRTYSFLIIIFIHSFSVYCEAPLPLQVFDYGSEIWDIDISQDGSEIIIVIAGNDYVKIYNNDTGQKIKQIGSNVANRKEEIREIDISDNGKYILIGQYNNAYAELWEIDSETMIQKYGPHEPWYSEPWHINPSPSVLIVSNLDISPDQNWVLTIDIGRLITHLWNLQTGEEMYQFPISNYGSVVGFSPDMKYILSGGELYNFATKELVYRFFDIPILSSSAFSPDSQYLLYGESKEITLRDLSRGYLIKRYVNYSSSNCISFSPDGKMFACSSESNPIRILETFTGKLMGVINDASLVDFSPDGKTLLTNGPENKAYLWDLNDLIESQTGIKNYEQY